MTANRFPYIKEELRKVLSTKFEPALVLGSMIEGYAHTSVKRALHDMAVSGEIETQVEDVNIRGRLQRTNCYRLKQEDGNGDQRKGE